MKFALGGNSATTQETRAAERNHFLILYMSPLVSDLDTSGAVVHMILTMTSLPHSRRM